MTAFSLGPGLTELTVFGGTAIPWKGSEDKQPKLAETTLLQVGEKYIKYIPHYMYTLLTCIHVLYIYFFVVQLSMYTVIWSL